MKYPTLLLHVLLAVVALSCATSCSTVTAPAKNDKPQRTTLSADRVLLPTVRDHFGYLYVDVKINGKGPFKFLVDTGCSLVVLSQHVADAAGLKQIPGITVLLTNAAGNQEKTGGVFIDSLESGGLKLEGLRAVFGTDANLAAVSAASGRILDGMLGMNALSDLLLEMDFAGKQVTAVKRGSKTYPILNGVDYTGDVPLMALKVGNKTVSMAIDTGDAGGVALPSFDGVPLLYSKLAETGAGAVLGKTSGKRGSSSQLAGEARAGPVVWVNPPVAEMAHASKTGRIGVAALDTWKLAIDVQAHRIYFLGDDLHRVWEKASPPDTRFGLGFFSEIEGTALRLTEVDADGAAGLAGLKAGDLILTINGQPAASGYAGTAIRVPSKVRRGNREFEVMFVRAPDYSPRQTILPADRVQLPTTASHGALMIDAFINGTGPFRLLVASGDRALRVSQRVVDAVGLKPMADWKVTPDQNADTKVVWVENLESGGLELKGLAALVASPVAMANNVFLLGPMDGTIGLEALKDLVLEVDLPAKKINAVKLGAMSYPAERSVDLDGARVKIDVAGQAQTAFINTGSNRGIQLPLIYSLPLLRPKAMIDEVGFSSTAERLERGQLAGELRAGPVSWVRPVITDRKNPQIGTSALGIWKLVFDQQARKLYFLDGKLERIAVDPPPVRPEFKTGFFAWMVGSALRLSQVDEGGAFWLAGLRPGDLILTVEGRPVREWMQAFGFFSGRTKSRLKVRAQRDGVEFDAELVLAPNVVAE